MILVMLGTNPYPFTRLLHAVDRWVRRTGEHVIAQTGHTPCRGVSFECHPFVDHDRILQWASEAELIITQGGFGSLRDALRAGKPTIAVPRLPELNESVDNQSELVDALAAEGWIIALHDVEHLPRAVEQARSKTPPSIPPSRIPAIVARKVDEVLGAP